MTTFQFDQHTQVTGAGLKHLAGLKNLQSLNLFHIQATDTGLEGLAVLKNLQSLYLGDGQVTGADLKNPGDGCRAAGVAKGVAGLQN